MVDSSKLIQSYSQDELLEAVKLAYDGYFGETSPLTQDPGCREWTERVFDRKPERGHKICSSCHRNPVSDAKFCQHCGKQLPDRVYYSGPESDRARIWLAGERKCEPQDVPDEDVKARALHADGSEDY